MNVIYSFIIPHYNLPLSLLRRLLDSIPHREDIQIIIVDDHTPSIYGDDGVIKEECKRTFPGYGDECTEIIFLPKNGGPGHARNEGLKIAKGKWILFADADDYYVTKKLEMLLSLCDDTSCDVVWFGEEESPYGRQGCSNRIVSCSQKEKLDFLPVSSPCNKIIRRQFLEDNNIAFDESFYGEDQIMSAQIVCESVHPGLFAEHVYVYDRREGSLSKTEDLTKLLFGFETEIKYNKYLRKKNVLSIKHRNVFLGGLLFRIWRLSPWKYRECCIKEFLLLGWNIAWADYKESCVQRCIRPNLWYQITDPVRVKIGSLFHR